MTIYDLTQIRTLAAGDEDFVKTMVETFLEHTPQQLDEMIDALEIADYKVVGALAHKMKPSLDMMGLNQLHDPVRSIERNGKTETDTHLLKEQVDYLNAELRLVFDEIRKDFDLK